MNTLREVIGQLSLAFLLFGCGGGTTRTSPPVSPIPTTPTVPAVVSPPASAWTFAYAPGALRYRISRAAVIESQSDSGSKQEASTNLTHELVTLSATGDSGILFTAVVDTFTTTTQGLIGSTQAVQLPVQVTGSLASHALTINSDSTTGVGCNPVVSTLMSDLHSLLTRFPTQLSQGMAWRDSVDSNGCQAAIPTTSHTVSSYSVSGEADYESRRVLLIQRSDTVQAHGEGAQQQHPLKLDVRGTGNAVYYLDTNSGRVVRITSGQDLGLTIITSAKVYRFRQRSSHDFRLEP